MDTKSGKTVLQLIVKARNDDVDDMALYLLKPSKAQLIFISQHSNASNPGTTKS